MGEFPTERAREHGARGNRMITPAEFEEGIGQAIREARVARELREKMGIETDEPASRRDVDRNLDVGKADRKSWHSDLTDAEKQPFIDGARDVLREEREAAEYLFSELSRPVEEALGRLIIAWRQVVAHGADTIPALEQARDEIFSAVPVRAGDIMARDYVHLLDDHGSPYNHHWFAVLLPGQIDRPAERAMSHSIHRYQSPVRCLALTGTLIFRPGAFLAAAESAGVAVSLVVNDDGEQRLCVQPTGGDTAEDQDRGGELYRFLGDQPDGWRDLGEFIFQHRADLVSQGRPAPGARLVTGRADYASDDGA